MEDYVIAIRSHKRSKKLEKETWSIIKNNHLENKTYIFVNDDEVNDYSQYPNVIGVKVKKGKDVFIHICNYFPVGQQIVFMDDDLIRFYTFNSENKVFLDSTHLDKLIKDGFELIDTFSLGAFSCSMNTKGSYVNRLWIRDKPEREFCFKFLQGCFFGCRNDPSLICSLSDQDDTERTANFIERYKGILYYHRAGMKNNFGQGEGGLADSTQRTSASRLEQTKKDAEELIQRKPLIFEKVKWNRAYNWYDLKLKNSRVLKKILQPSTIVLPEKNLFD